MTLVIKDFRCELANRPEASWKKYNNNNYYWTSNECHVFLAEISLHCLFRSSPRPPHLAKILNTPMVSTVYLIKYICKNCNTTHIFDVWIKRTGKLPWIWRSRRALERLVAAISRRCGCPFGQTFCRSSVVAKLRSQSGRIRSLTFAPVWNNLLRWISLTNFEIQISK